MAEAKERLYTLVENIWIFKEQPVFEYSYSTGYNLADGFKSTTHSEDFTFPAANKIFDANSWSNKFLINQFTKIAVSNCILDGDRPADIKTTHLEHSDHGYTFSCCSWLDEYWKDSFAYGRFDAPILGIFDTEKELTHMSFDLKNKDAAATILEYHQKVLYSADDLSNIQ